MSLVPLIISLGGKKRVQKIALCFLSQLFPLCFLHGSDMDFSLEGSDCPQEEFVNADWEQVPSIDKDKVGINKKKKEEESVLWQEGDLLTKDENDAPLYEAYLNGKDGMINYFKKMTKELEDCRKECLQQREENSQLKAMFSSLEKETSKVSHLEKETSQLRSKVSSLEKETRQIKEENEDLKIAVQRQVEKNRNLKIKVSHLEKKSSQQKSEIDDLKDEINNLKEKNNLLQQENTRLQSENNGLKEENSKLREKEKSLPKETEKEENSSKEKISMFPFIATGVVCFGAGVIGSSMIIKN